ncbi:hypothetical protein FGIG_01320 [Fasciola gigantica]|uniref:F5/8 type C domain-containing protein n=1 Tax=Fasciola gigantica TaxID=46835 RepID=A0A504Z094_FASGI|nr:hypothetical protein FGIG_01320 [Fasciola gigantica]
MVLHNGPWVSKVDLTSNGSEVLWNDNSDIRLFVQHTSRLYFESEIIVSARVQFAKEFGLPNDAKLKLISFTLEVDCNLMSNVRGNITVPSYTTANVVLHRSRDAYTNLIALSSGPITDCRVRTWTIDMFVTPRSQHRQNPEVHVPHINLDMGILSTFYYVRINLTTTNSITFRSQILMTTDGRSYTPVEQISFARHRNHSYSCVFTWPIRARGLLVVPLIPVVKHEIPTQDIQLYGTVDKRDVYQYDPCQPPYLMGPAGGLTLPDWMLIWKRSFIHVGDKMVVCYPEDSWNDFRAPKMICYCAIERDPLVGFDLGNRVSQVITYQTEDKIFIGIEPQRQGIVVSRDLEHWTGWSMSTFRCETDGKHLQNATYLPWEETDKFNKNLVGKKCSAYTSGD